jgi:hypothetical protein
MSLKELERPVLVAEERHRLDYATVKAELDIKLGFPRAWIKAATADELAQAADDLLAERDEKRIFRYLRVFWLREFPRPPGTIFHLVKSLSGRIAVAATRVLKRIQDAEIRGLALELLAEGILVDLAVGLLQSNFQSGDFKLVEDVLEKQTPDEDTWHGLGIAVIDVLENNDVRPEESRRLLLRLYEEGPCSMCRKDIVAKLLVAGDVPDWMAEECLFDANVDTAALFKG